MLAIVVVVEARDNRCWSCFHGVSFSAVAGSIADLRVRAQLAEHAHVLADAEQAFGVAPSP